MTAANKKSYLGSDKWMEPKAVVNDGEWNRQKKTINTAKEFNIARNSELLSYGVNSIVFSTSKSTFRSSASS